MTSKSGWFSLSFVRTRTRATLFLLALGTVGCTPGEAPFGPVEVVEVNRRILPQDAERPPECDRRHPVDAEIAGACNEMITLATSADLASAERSKRPRLVLLPDGRLRYTDHYFVNSTVEGVASGLDVGFTFDGWKKIATGRADVIHYRRPMPWGTLDLTIRLEQVGNPAKRDERRVEVKAVMKSMEPVPTVPYCDLESSPCAQGTA